MDKKAHHKFKSTQDRRGDGNQSIKAGYDFIVLYYFLGQVTWCLLADLTFASRSTKTLLGLAHSTFSMIGVGRECEQDFVGLTHPRHGGHAFREIFLEV